MKVIDLLNKIANGEKVPKKIKINDEIWTYDQDIDYKASDGRGYLFEVYIRTNHEDLNVEVEIIQDGKIEKLEIYQEKNCKNNWKWKCNDYNISKPQKIIADKVNEIIEVLNER